MNISAAARMPITAPIAAASAYAPIILVIAGTLLLTLSAKLQIPLWPVPMTMQTYVILVIAMAYGTRLGVATVSAYLLAGARGYRCSPERRKRESGLRTCSGRRGATCSAFCFPLT